jgi:starvation-inducible DNA-binding protein
MRISTYITIVAAMVCAVSVVGSQEIMMSRDQPAAPAAKGLGLDPAIGISASNRDAVCKLLNTLLADEYLLYVKTQNYHWNVTGLMFNDLHLFFGKQYAELAIIIDMVAERVRALGGHAIGTMDEFIKNARLKEEPLIVTDHKDMIKNLLVDHEAIIKLIRKDIAATAGEYNDAGTNNFLSDLLTKHEKIAWMLRSYIS